MQGQRAVHSSLLSLNHILVRLRNRTIQGLKRESLLSLNHDQRLNRNEHLDKGRLRFHDGSIQIPTKCDQAKGRLEFNEPEPIQG